MMIRMAVAGRCSTKLGRLLSDRGVRTVGEVVTVDELDRLAAHAPDLLVCFAETIATDDLVRLVRHAGRRWFTAVVGRRDWPHAAAVIHAGARLYLVCEEPGGDDAVAATIAAIAPPQPAPPDLRPSPPTTRSDARDTLSQREREALSYIAAGYTHQQTATRMRVTRSTVDTFITRIRTKLGVGNKAELTMAAMAVFGQAPTGGGWTGDAATPARY